MAISLAASAVNGLFHYSVPLATQRSYLRQNAQIVDSLLRGVLEPVAFVQNPFHKEVTMRSLVKHLKLKNAQEAENGYQAPQWLYSLDIRTNLKGIQNMQRLLAVTNPKVKGLKADEIIDEAPVLRLERSQFYRDLMALTKKITSLPPRDGGL